MVFYCTGGILFYYLFYKSRYVPIVLSLWGIIAVSVGFIGMRVLNKNQIWKT